MGTRNIQYEVCQKKLDIINSKIIRLNNFILDNSDLSNKINKFQSKTEENIIEFKNVYYTKRNKRIIN